MEACSDVSQWASQMREQIKLEETEVFRVVEVVILSINENGAGKRLGCERYQTGLEDAGMSQAWVWARIQ